MDPRKWGQRPHTYLSSFLESSTVKFKGDDECHLKDVCVCVVVGGGVCQVLYKAQEES